MSTPRQMMDENEDFETPLMMASIKSSEGLRLSGESLQSSDWKIKDLNI